MYQMLQPVFSFRANCLPEDRSVSVNKDLHAKSFNIY